ncbi:MAG: hypothetical protein ACYC93_10725 [Candidatus Acidiferrales bacterium]
MSDQVMNESAVVKQGPVRGAVMALPSSTSTSDHLLRRIATLLSILVAGLLTVFAYYASSICITVILAAFLAILFDPVVVKLETLRLPRAVAAAGIVLAGMGLIGLLGHSLYGRAMTFAEDLPVYMLWGGMKGAIPLEIASGLLNLLPFVGLVLELAVPLAAAILQFNTVGPFIVITLTILFLHVVSANLLVPKFIATRVSIGPVAATVGMLFWAGCGV